MSNQIHDTDDLVSRFNSLSKICSNCHQSFFPNRPNQTKHNYRCFPPRTCIFCEKEFIPNNGGQKKCFDCKGLSWQEFSIREAKKDKSKIKLAKRPVNVGIYRRSDLGKHRNKKYERI